MDPNFITSVRSKMLKALDVIKGDLATIRTGRATPALVENISIMAYGGTQRLRVMEVATISTPDSHSLILTPFDESIIGEIVKGITEGSTGLNPIIDTNLIRISIPPLSEERRAEFVKLMHQKLEGGKVMVRQVRHEAMGDAKKAKVGEDEESRLEKQIQEFTDEMMAEIEVLGEKKEQELMQI